MERFVVQTFKGAGRFVSIMRMVRFAFLPAMLAACAGAGAGAAGPATLGARTRGPTREEAAALGLAHKVRVQGQMIESVEPGGPAGAAGLRKGDALLALDRNPIFSADDVADFLATSGPGRRVVARIQRREGESEVAVTLGSGRSPEGGRMTWEFSGLAQLEDALRAAKQRGTPVLVGLSGAET